MGARDQYKVQERLFVCFAGMSGLQPTGRREVGIQARRTELNRTELDVRWRSEVEIEVDTGRGREYVTGSLKGSGNMMFVVYVDQLVDRGRRDDNGWLRTNRGNGRLRKEDLLGAGRGKKAKRDRPPPK